MRRARHAVLAAVAMVVPVVAQAQYHRLHEIGVDVSLAAVKPSGTDLSLQLVTPVDVRVGLTARGPLSVEPRLALFVVVDGGTRYSIAPGINLLYRLGGTPVNRNQYATFGAELELRRSGTSGAILAINGGLGMRRPWGAGAVRTEWFVRYAFEDTALGAPNTLALGVRVGLSMWH